MLVIPLTVILGVMVFVFGAGSSSGWNQAIFLQAVCALLLSVSPLVFRKQNTPLISVRTGANLMFALTFGIWPLAYMVTPEVSGGYISVWVGDPEDYFIETLWYALLGILCFQVGYILPIGQHIARKIKPPRTSWSRNKIVILSVLATIASLISAIAVWVTIGGGAYAGFLFGKAKLALDGYHYLSLGFSLLRISILVGWAYSLIRKFPRWIIFAQVVLYTVIIIFMGGRSQVIGLWIMLLLMYLLLSHNSISLRRISNLRIISTGTLVIVASVILLIVVRGFRTSYDASDTGLGLTIFQNVVDALAVLTTSILKEFDQLEVFATIVAITPEKLPFWYGQSYLDIFSLPIPRSLWADKPVPARLILGQLMRGIDVGIPPTVIGEFYFNFGIFGIIFGMCLFGIFCKSIDKWAYMYRTNPTVIIVFVFILGNVPIITTRYFYGWFGALLIFLAGIWIVSRFIRGPVNRNVRPPSRSRVRQRQ